jgi:O-antigen/teichoic acid export membrane protein
MIEIIANKDYLNRDIYEYTSSDAFIIVLLMIVFYFMFLLFQYIFIAAEKQSDLLKINIIITIFNII